MLITASSQRGEISLLKINPADGSLIQALGPIGFRGVDGLAFGPDGVLYGFANRERKVVSIDPGTGRGTALFDYPNNLGARTNITGAAACAPEPSTLTLMGLGALGLLGYARRRRTRPS
jgi:hypothetical protein